jgi:hypothetical protein
MSDLCASLIITGTVVLAALGVRHIVEVVTVRLTEKHGKAEPVCVPLHAWPSTILPCQSWVGRQIEEATPLHVVQAERIAEMAWYAWQASPVEEGNDDC